MTSVINVSHYIKKTIYMLKKKNHQIEIIIICSLTFYIILHNLPLCRILQKNSTEW